MKIHINADLCIDCIVHEETARALKICSSNVWIPRSALSRDANKEYHLKKWFTPDENFKRFIENAKHK